MTAQLFVTADNHLNRFVARLPIARLDDRRHRLRAAYRQVVDAAIHARAAALILGGDTFDAIDPRNYERAMFAKSLRRLREAHVTVIATGGNHDSPRQSTDHGGLGPYAEFVEAELLHYLGPPDADGGIAYRTLQADGQVIVIAGVPWRPGANGDPLDGVIFPNLDAMGDPNWRVFVTHAGIEGHAYLGPQEPVIPRASIAALEVDLFVSGHVHLSLSTTVTCPSGRLCHIVVPGSTERMTFGEAATQPGYVVVDLPRQGALRVTRRLIAAQPRVVLDVGAAEIVPTNLGGGRADATTATGAVVAAIEAVADSEAMATLRIHGAAPREVLDDLHLAEVQEVGARSFFSFDLDAVGLVPADSGLAMGPIGVRRSAVEEVRATINEMGNGASDDERTILEDAWTRIVPLIGGIGGDDHDASLATAT